MGDTEVPLTMKIMFVWSILLGVTGVLFNDDVSVVISVIALIILSCAISLLEGINKGFDKLIELELNNAKTKKL